MAEQKQTPHSLSSRSGDAVRIDKAAIKIDVPDIVSVSTCADLTLPPGAGLCIDTIRGPVFLVSIFFIVHIYHKRKVPYCSLQNDSPYLYLLLQMYSVNIWVQLLMFLEMVPLFCIDNLQNTIIFSKTYFIKFCRWFSIVEYLLGIKVNLERSTISNICFDLDQLKGLIEVFKCMVSEGSIP